MATYKKPSVAVSGTTLAGYPFSGDGAVYEALKAHRTATIKGMRSVVFIPFHAVKNYNKEVSWADVEAKDAYCE